MKLPGAAQTKLVRMLAELDVFATPRELRELLKVALQDAPRGKNFLRDFVYDGGPLVLARRLVTRAASGGTPPGNFLERSLGQILEHAFEDNQVLVINAALHALQLQAFEKSVTSAVAPGPHGEGDSEPFVMVSFSHADHPDVETLVGALRARDVRVVWDQDAPRGTDIPVWVWSTYESASWIVIACSEAYDRNVRGLLRNPSVAPPRGKGVAQEARFMAGEHMDSGTARFVPVILPGAGAHHIPRVVRGPLRFSVPTDYDRLAKHLRRSGPRSPRAARANTVDDEFTDPDTRPLASRANDRGDEFADPDTDPLTRLRREHIAAWRAEPERRHERFIDLELAPQGEEGRGAPRTYSSLRALMEKARPRGAAAGGGSGRRQDDAASPSAF